MTICGATATEALPPDKKKKKISNGPDYTLCLRKLPGLTITMVIAVNTAPPPNATVTLASSCRPRFFSLFSVADGCTTSGDDI